MLPSRVAESRDQRRRALRKILHDHIEEPESGCSCGDKRPAHRSSGSWWVEHMASVIAEAGQ